MRAYYLALAVFLTGVACRAVAARARVAPPRRFRIGERGWWFPPAPAAIEFATARARTLEIWGRGLMIVGSWLMVLATLTLARRGAG